jgi:hypothetical protein
LHSITLTVIYIFHVDSSVMRLFCLVKRREMFMLAIHASL